VAPYSLRISSVALATDLLFLSFLGDGLFLVSSGADEVNTIGSESRAKAEVFETCLGPPEEGAISSEKRNRFF
jgi:hypothetical protein